MHTKIVSVRSLLSKFRFSYKSVRPLVVVALGAVALAPFYVLAQCVPGTLCNPLRVNSIQDLASALIDLVLLLALPIGVLFIILGGFYLVTANGDEDKIKKGYRTILAAIIGIAIVLSAKLIAAVIGNTLRALGVGV